MTMIVWRDWMTDRYATDYDGNPRHDYATCGTCGRTWDDAMITALTPTPSARCPFEYDHEYGD